MAGNHRTYSSCDGCSPIAEVPKGTLIAFSTAAGATAEDGAGENSPYTKHLVQVLKSRPEQGLELVSAIREASRRVTQETHQTPWLNMDASLPEFHLWRPDGPTALPPARPQETRRQVTATFTVKEGDEKGPTVAGAKVEVLWRETQESEAVVLGTVTSDAEGKAQVELWLGAEQQRGGDFLVTVSAQGDRRSWPLPEFPKSVSWNLYVARREKVPADGNVPPSDENARTITNSIGMKLVLIPAGDFHRGSSQEEIKAWNDWYKAGQFDVTADDEEQHTVIITKPFYLGVYPVTQAEYENVMGENPSKFKGDGTRPVENVSWIDAVAFCKKLSDKEGKEYRLPTEAEWEYACRAGSGSRWYCGDDVAALGEYAWYPENSGKSTHPVGQKKPNAFGLYDMHGNVSQWCNDVYGYD
jgi:formylglycine-generating enzyme required for sulfatase activity